MNSEAAKIFHASARRFCTVFCMSDFDYIQKLKSFSLSRFEYMSWKSVVLFFLDLIVDLHVAFWVGGEGLACVGVGVGVAWIVSWAGEVEELFPERFLPEIFWHPSSCHVFEDVNFSSVVPEDEVGITIYFS